MLAVLLRLYSRLGGPRRLFWDDVFIIVAEIVAISIAALWQWSVDSMYSVLEILTTQAIQGSLSDAEGSWRRFLNMQLVASTFFPTTLLLVKLSFLFFFKRLGKHVHLQKYLWWPVLIFTVATFAVSISDGDHDCFRGSLEVQLQHVKSETGLKQTCGNFSMSTLKINMALDVVSDFLSTHGS